MKPGMTIVKGLNVKSTHRCILWVPGVGRSRGCSNRRNKVGFREDVEPDRDWHCHLRRLGCGFSVSTGCKTALWQVVDEQAVHSGWSEGWGKKRGKQHR